MDQAQVLRVNDEPCNRMRSTKDGWILTCEGAIRVAFPTTSTENPTGVQEWVKGNDASRLLQTVANFGSCDLLIV